MTEKLGRSSSRRDNRKIGKDLSDLSPTKSSGKNELKIGENDYFSDANMDLSRFEKAVENRTKSQVEEERELVKKATRANERLMTKIHEASQKSTLKEAEYTMKVSEREDGLVELYLFALLLCLRVWIMYWLFGFYGFYSLFATFYCLFLGFLSYSVVVARIRGEGIAPDRRGGEEGEGNLARQGGAAGGGGSRAHEDCVA
jgi:hypothetical protein